MNNMAEVRFEQQPIKVSKDTNGSIEKICIDDVCRILRREIFLTNGTAIRKCPSAIILDENSPRDRYADFDEVIRLIRWMSAESKILARSGRKLLEFLQQSRMAPISIQQPPEGPQSHTETESVMELEYSGNKFTMKMCDGRYMVNATEMSRPFDKRPNVWLKTTEAVKLRQALVDDGVCATIESQVITTRGSCGATWLEIHLWIHFAQWLSPAFASWCSKKIFPLMKDGHVSLADEPATETDNKRHEPPRYDDSIFTDDSFLPVPENYETALAVIEKQRGTIQKQCEFIRHNKHKFEHYEETIEAREWFSTTMIAHELGISAVKLNLFLMDENVQQKIDGEWNICREYRHLRDYHFYEWFNFKTKYTHKFKIDSWTPEGREYIIELWKKENG